eukprot:CAMPEP_0174831240 /NCGR_PEP_ID=MMETSP1114-20130205/2985_1 /TAXON_ID=312471 /ORGANISM="Neobodo designis, Strain CCAP 1951/1" /LENGTH=107 /DNA_ID=CAMNT_0016065061 /DNA_START=26 /DNA_END=345 /DNA_ORIENTATION=+
MPPTEAQQELLTAMEKWIMASEDLMAPLEAFAKEHCATFAPAAADFNAENKVEYTPIFEKYQQLFEAQLEAFLKERGVGHEDFVAACQASAEDSGAESVGLTDFIVA